ncbi:MAG: hypothetical protein M1833_006183 [Piccolia ochrophora]|nr:MAG: hypothetical protein M1833_006183 [Piccolia ochrophora]
MPAQNTSDILAALAKMAQQNTAAPPAAKAAPQDNHNNVTNSQTAMPPHVSSSVNQPAAFQAPTQPVNMPVGMPNLVNQFGGSALNGNAVPNAPNPLASIAAAMPQANGGASTEALQQQLMLVQVLMQQGIPQEQWGPIIAALSAQGANANLTAGAGAITNASNGMAGSNVGGFGGVAGGAASGASSAWPPPSGPQSSWDGRKDQQSRDPAGNANRSPPGRYQRRDRSRSPAYGRGSPPLRKRDSPIYGEYNSSDSPGRGGGGRGDALDRRGRGNRGRGRATDYRQRSPPPGRRSPERHDSSGAPSKWMDFDPLLGKDNIKVLSRTLFVGGVTSSESDLKGVFSQFGNVQTCIVNVDRHHAFIKMVTRDEAVIAKEGMETHRSPNMQLRTRWGVGFGPRDCSDYQTGISIIPIHRLTDADRKWMLTAEYGGSGGKPIEGGMVVEEPDIEIGAGVSSKAISRRMATDQGGRTGPRSSRIPGAPETGGGARFRRPDRHDGPGPAPESVNAIGVPPAVPGFGFQMPGAIHSSRRLLGKADLRQRKLRLDTLHAANVET